MFVADTQIFTDSGWKPINKIGGKDRVLVRNFLGDAEFMQPFAVKKKKWNAELIRIGAKDWSFSVTPDQLVVYEIDSSGKFRNVPAKDFVITPHNKIHRKFKYFTADDLCREQIRIRDEFGTRTTQISHQDWYKLVGYVLQRGFIRMKRGKPMVWLFLDEDNIEEEKIIIGDILDRIGLRWHLQHSDKTRAKIVVSSKNTLAARLITRLGSPRRKDMSLPDKMVYNSSRELTKLLFETFMQQRNQFATTNKALIDSLTLMGTLGGYSVRSLIKTPAGTEIVNGVTEKDSYLLHIRGISEVYSAKYKKKQLYSGYVYGIDIFEGQVYVKQGSMPVWMSPK